MSCLAMDYVCIYDKDTSYMQLLLPMGIIIIMHACPYHFLIFEPEYSDVLACF